MPNDRTSTDERLTRIREPRPSAPNHFDGSLDRPAQCIPNLSQKQHKISPFPCPLLPLRRCVNQNSPKLSQNKIP